MLKSLKKNQVVIFAIALMFVAVGYLGYTMTTEQVAETSANTEETEIASIGDARLVSNNNAVEEETTENNEVTDSNIITTNNVESSQTKDKDIYFNQSRLDREKMYSEMLETYQSILANTEISADQKKEAQTEISRINNQRNSIMIAENLIKNKGFSDIVIFVNNDSVSAVVQAEKIETAEAAQIQSIIQRELNVNIENIHISNK